MSRTSPAFAVCLASSLVVTFVIGTIAWPCQAQLLPYVDITSLDPSVQSAGMGGATVAAHWLDQPNSWINPALTAFQRGITYSYGSTDLFGSEVKFQTHQIQIGAHGIGLEISGKPIEALGRSRVDYGPFELTDVNGFVIGEATYVEEVRTLAIGVDVVALFASFKEASGGERQAIRDRLSVAIGHTWKDLKATLEDYPFGDAPEAEGDVKDAGALFRFAAVDQIGETLGEASQETRHRFEIAGGYSKQNWDDDYGDDFTPLQALNHYGASLRLTIAPPTTGSGWLADYGSPSIGFALLWTGVDQDGFAQATNLFGAEASLYDIVFLRGGLVDDGNDFGDTDFSLGGGLKLHYRKTFGARFDYARDSGELDRFQGSVFLDPIRMWRGIR